MDNAGNKVPVMLLFFNRPDTLAQVFSAVQQYRPKELFLVQDGARKDRPDDEKNIEKCRSIVENITWDCHVHRNYAEENMSCDHREYTGIDWCFQHVDKLIILEDDCVPTQGFFKLCEECLEKYQDDTNIHSVIGFNRVGTYDAPYDYVFSMTSCGLGWATWKRVWEKVRENQSLEVLDNKEDTEYLNTRIDKNIKKVYGDFIPYMQKSKQDNMKAGKVTSWEKLVGFTLLANNMLTITPCRNTVEYIGISENATHSLSDPRLMPHKVRKVLTQRAYDLEGKLQHPPFIVRDTRFEELSGKAMKSLKYLSKIESRLRRLWYGKLFRKR